MKVPTTSLDANSEMLALSTYANTKNLIITGIELFGDFDYEAMKLAAERASLTFPQIRSVIDEVREKGRHKLHREYRPDLPLPVFVADLSTTDPTLPTIDRVMDHLRPRLDREWDLRKEVASEFHFIRVSKDHHVLAVVLHHVAADAGITSEFIRELFLEYHEIITEEKPPWAFAPYPFSTSRKRFVRKREKSRQRFFPELWHALGNLMKQSVIPVGSGDPQDRRQYQIKRLLSVEESATIWDRRSTGSRSLVDVLTAAVNLSIDEWNRERGVGEGSLTTVVTVNMKGRFRGMDTPNNSALLIFNSQPDQREGPAEFLRFIARERARQFRNQMDFKFFRDVSRMNVCVSYLPYHLRRRAVHLLTNRHRYSATITLLGVIWPATENGKLTTDSSLTGTGHLAIMEVHGIGYKLLSRTPLVFVAYVFRKQLNVVLAASASVFTRWEAESFMDLAMKNLSLCLSLTD